MCHKQLRARIWRAEPYENTSSTWVIINFHAIVRILSWRVNIVSEAKRNEYAGFWSITSENVIISAVDKVSSFNLTQNLWSINTGKFINLFLTSNLILLLFYLWRLVSKRNEICQEWRRRNFIKFWGHAWGPHLEVPTFPEFCYLSSSCLYLCALYILKKRYLG